MFILTSKKNEITRYILQEGCILIKEDGFAMHPELNIQNLQVQSIATSYTAKGYLKRVFVWKHGYYTLTAEGQLRLSQDLCIEGNFIEDNMEIKPEVENFVEETL